MSSTTFTIPVDHVSDTAYLVAMYRAFESERADAKFNDPFAKLLSEPLANKLESVVSFQEMGTWMMTVRTCAIDAHVTQLVSEGIDTVINLAAGLDTRPYRLGLPATLKWVEADLPAITAYKSERLAGEHPTCQLERVVVDLSDDMARRDFLAHATRNSKKVLVITEGLLPYLPQEAIDALAEDLKNTAAVTHWVMDVTTESFFVWANKLRKAEEAGKSVSLRFSMPNGAHYFEKFGFKVTAFDSFSDGTQKLDRVPPQSIINDPDAALAAEESGIALLSRV